jgi:hypothetical protein
MAATMQLRSNIHVDYNGEGALLLDLNTSKILVLNQQGAEIVQRLLAQDSLDTIAEDIAKRHSCESSQVLGDATEFVEGLVKEQVLERC